MTLEFRQRQETLSPAAETAPEARLVTQTQSSAERTALAFRMTPGPATTMLQESSTLNLARQWHTLMRTSLVPELVSGLRARRDVVLQGLQNFAPTQSALQQAIDSLLQRSETFLKDERSQAFSLFFQVEQVGQSLQKTVASAPPEIQAALTSLLQFVGDMYNRMQLERPAMHREGYRGREVDKKAGNALRLLFVVGATGGFAIQGALFAFAKDGNGNRVTNPTALALYGSLLGMGVFGDRMLNIFRAPGTVRMEDSVAQMRFIGDRTFESITRQNGIGGADWARVAEGVYRMRGDLSSTVRSGREFTPSERQRIVGLAPNDVVRGRLEQMLTARGGPRNAPGEPMRDFIGLLFNARTAEAERAVVAYFEGRGTPDQVRRLMLVVDNPPPSAPTPAPDALPPGPVTV